MENDNSKIMTLSFMCAGFLAWLVTGILFDTLAATFSAVASLRANQLALHGIPVLVGVSLFAWLQFNSGVKSWANEVITEISKIVWPSRKDTTAMTIVCCVMVLVAGVVFGVFDLVSSQLIKILVN